MTQDQPQKIGRKSLGEKLNQAVLARKETLVPRKWEFLSDAMQGDFEAIGLHFCELLSHDETASAVIAAQAEEIEEMHRAAVRYAEDACAAEAQVAAQSLRIASLENFASEILRAEDAARNGLSDCTDNSGGQYQSQWFADVLAEGRALLFPPQPTPGQEGG